MCQTRAQNGHKNLSNGRKKHQTGAKTIKRAQTAIPARAYRRWAGHANPNVQIRAFLIKRAEILQTGKNPGGAEFFAPLKIQVLANSWIVYNGKSQSKMDDEQGYLHFRKPPYNWNTLQKVESGPFGSIIYQLQRFYWYDLTVVSPIINLIFFGSYTGDTFHFFWATGDSFWVLAAILAWHFMWLCPKIGYSIPSTGLS